MRRPCRIAQVYSVLAAALLSFGPNAGAYEVDTHEAISEAAVRKSSLDTFLKQGLGLQGGVDHRVNGQRVVEWIRLGSVREDDIGFLSFRFRNHFHNPLLAWDQAGLRASHPFEGVQGGSSAILWGQDPSQAWSWARVRQYYADAFTRPTKAERDQSLADTFRGLGHLSHLIQDMASPAHTRNDPHRAYNYESLVQDVQRDEQGLFQSFLANPQRPDPGWHALQPNPLALLPIARLLDTDRYGGTNPAVTAEPLIGLAEYTNANFLSEDRIWSGDPKDLFLYPARSSVRPARSQIRLPSGDLVGRWYYEKVADGDAGYRLATVSVLREYFVRYRLDPDRANQNPALDEIVYRDYAARLLPRAVGYSAALLDYFFRGKLDAHLESFRESVDGPLVLRVINRTPEDTMVGSLDLYYDTVDRGRQLLRSWGVALAPDVAETLEPATLPADAMPGGSFLLVFRGRLGNDPDAVVAQRVGFAGYYLTLYALEPAELEFFRVEDISFGSRVFLFPAARTTPFEREDFARSVYRNPELLSGDVATVSPVGECSLGPAAATFELVEVEEPHDLATLLSLTLKAPPPVRRILATFTVLGFGPPVPVNIAGVRFFGIRLLHGRSPFGQCVGEALIVLPSPE